MTLIEGQTVTGQIKDLIDKDLDKVILRSKKIYKVGARCLKGWDNYDEDIDDLLLSIVGIIQKKFHYSDSDNEAGSAKVMNLLSSIGMLMITVIDGYPVIDYDMWLKHLRCGHFVIEKFIIAGYITVDRESVDREGSDATAPWVFHPTHKWAEIIPLFKDALKSKFSGIYETRPTDIVGLFNTKTGRPIVKKWTDTDKFRSMVGTDFIKGLDGIRQTGWRINKPVLDAVLNSDLDLTYGDIPSGGKKRSVLRLQAILKEESRKFKDGEPNEYEKSQVDYEEQMCLWTEKKDALSKRSTCLDKSIILQKASGLVEFEDFYYDVEVDYRGRIYYAESHLHYQGSDLAKGLLEFSDGKVMDTAGYIWLLRHIACLYNESYSKEQLKEMTWTQEDYVEFLNERDLDDISVDKMSLEDRFRWSVRHTEELLDIGRNRTMMYNKDKYVMLLAACIDLVGYHEAMSEGVPYISHLPVSVDGSNNGCQHTSAMNRDLTTGSKVGLTPRKIPEDLYVLVMKDMELNNNNMCERRGMTMADMRKNISKRATMTRQYSAGAESISNSMFSDCYQSKATIKFGITAQDCDLLSRKAIKSIDTICTSNTSIRKFLQRLVDYRLGVYGYRFKDGTDATSYRKEKYKELYEIKGKQKKKREKIMKEMECIETYLKEGDGADTVSWTTPAGFLVECELFRTIEATLPVTLDKKKIQLVGQIITDKPNSKKHSSAIAANMVHSMDATHMVLTVVRWCEKGNRSFGAVHDSFAVHACDVDGLLVDIKETFIGMYKDFDAYQFFIDQIITDTDGLDITKPELGELDLDEIRNSDYFFA